MDLWVFGAAAAAGYIARHWQSASSDRDSLSGSGPSKCEKNENPSFPVHVSARRTKLTDDNTMASRLSDIYRLDSASESDVCSGGYVEKLGSCSGNGDECNMLSLSSLAPGVTTTENQIENGSGNGLSADDMDDHFGRLCIGEIDLFRETKKKTNSLRTKHLRGHSMKPLNSLESCLMAQLYREHTKMEEYVLSVLPSPSKKLRPLLVTDGNQIINKLNSDPVDACVSTDVTKLHKDESVCGVPALPKASKLEFPRKIKLRTREVCNERVSSSHKVGRRHFHLQNGSLDRTYLFCLGITVGIASSLLTSTKEVDKLQDLLKQTENLVQDLQEELEMKDSLTVKELADENCESQDTCEYSLHCKAMDRLFPLQSAGNSTKNDSKESQNEIAEENSEDMSKIEAELEAELERLGLNMNASSMERRLSDLVELDSDFVADFAQGELRADMVNRRAINQQESDLDKSGNLTTRSGNYAVSPRELSLRLHEVLESQLEERVKQLELALQNSQTKVKQMESEHKNAWRKLLRSELRYSSDEGSPVFQELNSTVQPLVMNLSGEAIDAYNEAYEELININESEDDDSPAGVYENSHERGIYPFNENMLQGDRNVATNGSTTRLVYNEEKPSHVNQLRVAVKQKQGIQELLYGGTSEDENSSSNDEMEKQLIKQIVEKTRKGSPVVLNAQKLLFSMDLNEH